MAISKNNVIGRRSPAQKYLINSGSLYEVILNGAFDAQLIRNYQASDIVLTVSNGSEYFVRVLEYNFRCQSYAWSTTSGNEQWAISLSADGAQLWKRVHDINEGDGNCDKANDNTGSGNPRKIANDVIDSGGVGLCRMKAGRENMPTSINECRNEMYVKIWVHFPTKSKANAVNENVAGVKSVTLLQGI